MQFRLRTLMILLAILPPVLAAFWLWPVTIVAAGLMVFLASAIEWVIRNTPRGA